MTRKKVKLAYITNDSARKATFKKRKKGLIKKVTELSTLCGIEACAIIYSPYDAHPEVWPSPIGVQRVLSQFKNMPEMEQSKKMVNQESFLRQRATKSNEQLKKQRKENREKEVTQVMFQSLTGRSLNNLNMMDLNDLTWVIDQYLKQIYKLRDPLDTDTDPVAPPPLPPIALAPPTLISPATLAPPTLISPATLAPPTLPTLPPLPSPENAGLAGIGEVVAPQNLQEAANMEAMQRQQWIMDMINPNENMGFGGDDMIMPFGDNNNNNNNPNSHWSNGFFH
ncbi:agamous-like MADS-box protein AGL80 [Mercurialis annua]|uniref:agamous-like MADS-box protein AGL80 n=1 Tax=Mercurialis annua TaxID=3986 RepID=UPI00216067DB|nr:agamous-like MADS-box protein AGL80 [Mercurialis annua]